MRLIIVVLDLWFNYLMQKTNLFRIMLVMAVLTTVSLACGLFTNFQRQVDEGQATLDFAATQLQKGKNQISTLEALSTQAFGSEAIQTIQALAEKEGPGLLATSEALLRDAPNLLATLGGYATALPGDYSQNLVDVPIMWGDKTGFTTNQNSISYTSRLDLRTVVNFHDAEMPGNGWDRDNEKSVVLQNSAMLIYRKPGRTATILLNAVNEGTTVLVIVE